MRRFLCLTRGVAFLLLLVSSQMLRAEHHERKRVERTEIQALEEKWRQAQLAEDTAAMEQLLSDEYIGITASGQIVTKLQQLDRMRTRRLDIHKMDLSDTKIKISGNLAVVTSLAQIDGTAEGRPLQGAYRYMRVYQRQPGDGWKITNFEATRVGHSAGTLPQASSGALPVSAPNSPQASPAESASQRPPS